MGAKSPGRVLELRAVLVDGGNLVPDRPHLLEFKFTQMES